MSEPIWTINASDLREYLRSAKESAWDAAVDSMTYSDGSKVELMTNSNPYRKES